MKKILGLMKNAKPHTYLGIFFFVSVIVLFFIYGIPFINSSKFKEFIESIGIFGPLVIIFYIVISHIFAPIIGGPGVVVGYIIYGLIASSILNYIAGLLSAAINFYISRKYGRDLVRKLSGEKTLKKIDLFTQKSGTMALIFARAFGFPLFEIISYAYGFTNMSFKKYIFVTSVVTAVQSALMIIVFRDIDFSTRLGLGIWSSTMTIFGFIFLFFIYRSYKNI